MPTRPLPSSEASSDRRPWEAPALLPIGLRNTETGVDPQFPNEGVTYPPNPPYITEPIGGS